MGTRDSQLTEWAEKYVLRARVEKSVLGPFFEKAKFTLVYDVNGKEYIDFNSGQMCSALGHNHPKIIDAIKESCETIIHSANNVYNVKEIELAKRLGEICPHPLKKSTFTLTGSDANEGAMAIAKKYTDGWEFVSPHISFHGFSDTARSITFASPVWRRQYGPMMGVFAGVAPYCYRCALNLKYPDCNLQCVRVSFELLDAESVGAMAGFITEPLFSAGGVVVPPQGWLKRVYEECKRRGILLILDESQTGLAKMGTTMFAFESEGIVPDILTLSKHLGGGITLSAVVTNEEIERVVIKKGLVIGHSHSNDPIGCAAGIASIDIIVNDNMCQKAQDVGVKWGARLNALYEKYEIIGDVRGRGLIRGIEFVEDRETKQPAYDMGQKVYNECLKNGLFFSVRRGGSVLRFVPPFCTTDEQINRAYEILDGAIRTTLDTRKTPV
jgi:2,2-dialkylglycine decarboxylase (pyruvate)